MDKTTKSKFRREARKVWRVHYGPITKGKHIHHIDGDFTNNDIVNLVCVTAEEHRSIHLEQGDMWAEYGTFISGAAEAGRIGGSVKSEAKRKHLRSIASAGGKAGKRGKSKVKSEARAEDWAKMTENERLERGRQITQGRRKAGLVPKVSRCAIRGPQLRGIWITPFGDFDSISDAAAASNCCVTTVKRRCYTSADYKFADWFFIPKGDGYGN